MGSMHVIPDRVIQLLAFCLGFCNRDVWGDGDISQDLVDIGKKKLKKNFFFFNIFKAGWEVQGRETVNDLNLRP